MKKAYVRDFMERGRIRIGTLYDYRRVELGSAIGDALEGTSETHHKIKEPIDVTRPENQSWVLNKAIRVKEGLTGVVFAGFSVIAPQQSRDCYLYCLSYRYSRAIMQAFGADRCIRVDDPEGFFRAVDTAVVATGLTNGHAEAAACDYSGRNRTHKMERVHPAILKNPIYAYQAEIRMIWNPSTDKPLKPIFVDVPELKRFCSYLFPDGSPFLPL
jgi:hypothetical protein